MATADWASEAACFFPLLAAPEPLMLRAGASAGRRRVAGTHGWGRRGRDAREEGETRAAGGGRESLEEVRGRRWTQVHWIIRQG